MVKGRFRSKKGSKRGRTRRYFEVIPPEMNTEFDDPILRRSVKSAMKLARKYGPETFVYAMCDRDAYPWGWFPQRDFRTWYVDKGGKITKKTHRFLRSQSRWDRKQQWIFGHVVLEINGIKVQPPRHYYKGMAAIQPSPEERSAGVRTFPNLVYVGGGDDDDIPF